MTTNENYGVLIGQYLSIIEDAKKLKPRFAALVPAGEVDKLEGVFHEIGLDTIISCEFSIDILGKEDLQDIHERVYSQLSSQIEVFVASLAKAKEYARLKEAQPMLL